MTVKDVITADWEDNGLLRVGNGANFLWLSLEEAKEVFDRLRQALDGYMEAGRENS